MRSRDPYAESVMARCFSGKRVAFAVPGAMRIRRTRLRGRSAAIYCASLPPMECATSVTGASIEARATRKSPAYPSRSWPSAGRSDKPQPRKSSSRTEHSRKSSRSTTSYHMRRDEIHPCAKRIARRPSPRPSRQSEISPLRTNACMECSIDARNCGESCRAAFFST